MINKQIIVGNVGSDAKYNNPNGPVSFSVATNENFKDKATGEWVTNTEWHNIVVWGTEKFKEYLADRIGKGILVYIEGKTIHETYEKDGEEKSITKVMAREVKILTTSVGDAAAKPAKKENTSSMGSDDDDDMDLPF